MDIGTIRRPGKVDRPRVHFDNVGEILEFSEGLNPISGFLLRRRASHESLMDPELTFECSVNRLGRIATSLEAMAATETNPGLASNYLGITATIHAYQEALASGNILPQPDSQ